MDLPMASEQRLVNTEDQLEMLRRIATQMTISRDVGEVLCAITNALVTTARVALARIWLYQKAASCPSCASESAGVGFAQEDPALHLAASAGLYTHLKGEHHRVPVGELKIGQV